jgi:crotonobetaine/carnitine-CoA ligase
VTAAGIRTIPELLRDATAAHPERLWLLHEDSTFTFAQTDAAASSVAVGASRRGIGQGDIALLVAHNSPSHVFAWLGLLRLGAVVLTVNPASTEAELLGFVDQAGPSLVVYDPRVDAAVEPAAAHARVPQQLVALEELLDASPNGLPRVAIEPRDPAVLIPTSGTTGRSKLVTQTHQGYVLAAEGFPWWLGLTPDDRLMTSLPIFHLNAPAYSLLGSMAVGASAVLLPRFSPSGFLDAARRYGATEFNSIGAMLEMLMRQPERPDDADNPLRLCYTGPSPARERHLEIEARFGLEVTCGYALSESTYGTVWPKDERPYGTLGVPRQHPTLGHINEARVVRDGAEVAYGDVGELELRNPAIMLGYHEMPAETAEVIVDGWLRTGDLVRRNTDGTLTFVSRAKEVIRRRGENLAPAEVEDALTSHVDVIEAAVIAVPAELGEDEIKAFVVAKPGARLDVDALRRWVADRVARFKVPRFVEVVDDLPRTPTGRVAKHRLPRERNDRERDFDQSEEAAR